MAVLPVIVRELQAQARQGLTYWLRIAGGFSLACALILALWTATRAENWGGPAAGLPPGFRAGINPYQTFGVTLFGKLNLFIFGAIWLFVPLAAADAISRERREGTLALLYLTELRSLGIVVGKAFVHMLRSLSLLLSMAPWLMLPVLFGGVELRDIRMALLIDFTSVLLAMAAGLLASTIPRDWLKSAILAEVFAAVLLLTMLHVHGRVLRQAVVAGLPAGVTPGTRAFWQWGNSFFGDFFAECRSSSLLERARRLTSLATNGSLYEPWYWGGTGGPSSDWQQIWTRLPPAAHAAWQNGALGLVAGAALVLAGATWLGARRVAGSWRDAPREGRDSELRQRWLTPRFAVPLLRRQLARALTANPIGWLQVYSPSARLVKWAWCLFLIMVEIVLSRDSEDLYAAQAGLGLLLLLGLTFSATGSFREELQTGAFELLLVTPVRERQIIWGRARGLWRQFLPAFLVFGAGCIYLGSGWSDADHARRAWGMLTRITTGFCTLPLLGLYFSVQRWNFFAAWLAACVVGLLPSAVGRMLKVPEWQLIVLQLGMALGAVLLLECRLRSRQFLLARNQGG